MSSLVLLCLVVAALGSGMMAGLFCSFSGFIMQALSEIPRPGGIAAMQSINRVIVKPAFLFVFFGTAIVSVLAIGAGWQQLDETALVWAVTGFVIYVLGSLVVTILFNVPLNNRLAAVDAGSEEGVIMWQTYLVIWVRWNHVRSMMTIVSTVCFIIAVLYTGTRV